MALKTSWVVSSRKYLVKQRQKCIDSELMGNMYVYCPILFIMTHERSAACRSLFITHSIGMQRKPSSEVSKRSLQQDGRVLIRILQLRCGARNDEIQPLQHNRASMLCCKWLPLWCLSSEHATQPLLLLSPSLHFSFWSQTPAQSLVCEVSIATMLPAWSHHLISPKAVWQRDEKQKRLLESGLTLWFGV